MNNQYVLIVVIVTVLLAPMPFMSNGITIDVCYAQVVDKSAWLWIRPPPVPGGSGMNGLV